MESLSLKNEKLGHFPIIQMWHRNNLIEIFIRLSCAGQCPLKNKLSIREKKFILDHYKNQFQIDYRIVKGKTIKFSEGNIRKYLHGHRIGKIFLNKTDKH